MILIKREIKILFCRSMRKTKSFVKSLLVLFFPTFGCLIALIVYSAMIDNVQGLEKLTNQLDWSILENAHVITITILF